MSTDDTDQTKTTQCHICLSAGMYEIRTTSRGFAEMKRRLQKKRKKDRSVLPLL